MKSRFSKSPNRRLRLSGLISPFQRFPPGPPNRSIACNPTFIRPVHTASGVADLGEGCAEVLGEEAGGGDGVRASLHLPSLVSRLSHV